MSLKAYFTLVLTLISCKGFSQELSYGVGYNYLYAKQWDNAIQIYNFSRPFLEENQPLLIHGTFIEVQYLFNSQKKLQSGIKLDHSYLRSRASNTDFKSKINLHFLNVGYLLRYMDKSKFENMALEFDVSVSSSRMSKRINGETLQVDDENNIAYGIGGKIGLTYIHRFELKNTEIHPFVGGTYSPYFWSPKAESILNKTTGLSSRKKIAYLTWKIGFRYLISKKS